MAALSIQYSILSGLKKIKFSFTDNFSSKSLKLLFALTHQASIIVSTLFVIQAFISLNDNTSFTAF
jgi:hypothetical protein